MMIRALIKKFLWGQNSTQAKAQEFLKKLSSAKAANIDNLELLKDRIKQLEVLLVRKKKEWENAKGPSRRIVGSEIEMRFRELDRLEGREKIIVGNIDRISRAMEKLEQILVGRDLGVNEDEITDIYLDAQETFDELKAADRAAEDLDKAAYASRAAEADETVDRLSEITGEKEAPTGMSADTEKRLKELEKE